MDFFYGSGIWLGRERIAVDRALLNVTNQPLILLQILQIEKQYFDYGSFFKTL